MSLFTFWAGVVVWSLFGLGYLIGTEYEARERWADWERARARGVRCPVGDLAGVPHTFRRGSGVVVDWCVMGDTRQRVEVCTDCASGGAS